MPQNNALWQDGAKTLFDPCPPGWRVPRSGDEASGRSPWNAFSLANSSWDPDNGGCRFNTSVIYGGTSWYSPAGFRSTGEGNVVQSTIQVKVWSSTMDSKASYGLHIIKSQVNPSGWAGGEMIPNQGLSVRCIRE